MDVRPLNGVDALARLLETDERDAPGMILVGSASDRLSCDLLEEVRRDTPIYPQFVFYQFDLDDYGSPEQDRTLSLLLDDIGIERLPAQILLPSRGCRPSVINAVSMMAIRRALRFLY
ncbi:hypothetical protein [Pseudomonas bharatica]|uniref:hypothetical protein n=1 Tax=Pseudomonas bharatica TaxID=2692112 RepID=UPI003B286AC4